MFLKYRSYQRTFSTLSISLLFLTNDKCLRSRTRNNPLDTYEMPQIHSSEIKTSQLKEKIHSSEIEISQLKEKIHSSEIEISQLKEKIHSSEIEISQLKEKHLFSKTITIYELKNEKLIKKTDQTGSVNRSTIFLFDPSKMIVDNSKDYDEYPSDSEPDQTLPCTHDLIENHWINSDYEFVFIKGNCIMCSFEKAQETPVLIQKGVLRFGGLDGFCLDCMKDTSIHGVQGLARGNDQLIEYTFKRVLPSEKPTKHTVRYNLSVFNNIDSYKAFDKGCGNLSGCLINEDQKQKIKDIVKNIKKMEPELKEMEKQNTKPFFCRTCKGHVDLHPEVNKQRAKGIKMIVCAGCNSDFVWNGGCATLTCPVCLAGTRTCGICLDGRVGFDHNHHPEVTDPLPMIQECKCPVM